MTRNSSEHVVARPGDREAGGFSLVSTLVAAALAIIGILAISQMYMVSSQLTTVASETEKSTELASNQLTRELAEDPDALDPGTEQDSHMNGPVEFRRETTVEDDMPLPGMMTIAVDVGPNRTGPMADRSEVGLVGFKFKAPDGPEPPRSPGSPAIPLGPSSPSSPSSPVSPASPTSPTSP